MQNWEQRRYSMSSSPAPMIHSWLPLVTQEHLICKLEKAQRTSSSTLLFHRGNNRDTSICGLFKVATWWQNYNPNSDPQNSRLYRFHYIPHSYSQSYNLICNVKCSKIHEPRREDKISAFLFSAYIYPHKCIK